MIRRIFVFVVVVVLSVSICVPKSLAAGSPGYFGASVQNNWWCNVLGALNSGRTASNCIDQFPGGNDYQDDALSYLDGSPGGCDPADSNCLKTILIGYIRDKLLNGGGDFGLEHTGAAFIVNTMDGQPWGSGPRAIYPGGQNTFIFDDWVNRVNNPAITAKIINFPLTENTAFDPITKDEVKYTDAVIAPRVLVFSTASGGSQYAIKLDCGNPVGTMPALPIPPAPAAPPISLTQPTFSVSGGDVVSGALLDASNGSGGVVPCGTANNTGPDPKAGIAAWNKEDAPLYTGSGATYAAFAFNQIQDFATAQGHSPPTALSFANDGTAGSTGQTGYFGGMFGSSPWCVDYWSQKQPAANVQPFSDTNLNNLSSGNFSYSAVGIPLRLNNSIVKDGVHATLYIDGDLWLEGNIVYQHSSNASGWSTITDIPSVTLVVHGRIFIDASVDELDGTYVAVPDAGYASTQNTFNNPLAGTISTCSNASGSYNPTEIATTNYLRDCDHKLKVYGSFAASQVWLLRTHGNLGGETAEEFHYGPEEWMALQDSDSKLDASYDAASGLPPTL